MTPGLDARATSLRPLTPWLLLALSVSVAVLVYGAGRNDGMLTMLAAGLYAGALVLTALLINAPLWTEQDDGGTPRAAVKVALASNVWLAALVYAWGASALFAVYSPLSDLVWRHGWQYGLGAAVFAAGLALYARHLDSNVKRGPPPLYLTALHGLAATGGLAYLVGAGKLATLRGDWAANHVFLAGGLAIVALCVISAITQTRAEAPA